ncbi:MAG: HlyD family efflux transporter periplasmic adaptor subunit [Planctomycetes bacterium]|nr:HlyD family efflux transporter periplasmic adaptor subunit [Planctomycetota bacterium]
MPASRPVPLRKRADLVVTRERFGERTYMVVKDPLALKYFRLPEEEYALLELLDGRSTLDELQTALEARFAPQKFVPEEISTFLASLHQAGLVVSEACGQGPQLLQRHAKTRRRQWLQKLMSPLSIRVPGIDPTPLFDRLYPCIRWCFSRTAVAASLCLMATALLLVLVQYDEFQRRLPTFHQFFTPSNMLLLLALTAGIKVLHEFGHGLTCRHFGGECHELGVMLLVFAPCLYCNVSDAWRLPKRSRVLISAAGIYVELVLASLAVFGWWSSGPGLWNQFCLGTMFVSGVSTLLINGNPLLRYDGYFILSDLVETPNLAEKSTALLRSWLVRFGLGLDDEPEPLAPRRRQGWFALYAVASLAYRVALSYGIFLFLMEWLRPYHLEVVARMFGLMALAGFTVMPAWRCARFFASSARRDRMRRVNVVGSSLAVAILVLVVVFVPLPQRVWGTLEIEPRDVARVYVDVPGRLIAETRQPGAVVESGAILARLENLDLELEVAKLAGRATEYRAQLAALRQQRFHDAQAALRIPELEKSLAAVEELLSERRSELNRLTLIAPRAGVVLPAPENPTPRSAVLGDLPEWQGLPSDRRNQGATLAEGTLFCQIGDTHEWQAVVAIDQTDVALVHEGQPVAIRFDEHADYVVEAHVAEISRRELAESSQRLSNKAGGELATETDAGGVERPISPTYQARIVLYDPHGLLRIGLRGTARIEVPPASLGSRAVRWLNRTFHFQL